MVDLVYALKIFVAKTEELKREKYIALATTPHSPSFRTVERSNP